MLKDQCGVNIDKDTGDIAFITYEKGEAEAKVGLIEFLTTSYRFYYLLSLQIRFKVLDAAKAPAAAWMAKEKIEIKGLTVVGSILEVGAGLLYIYVTLYSRLSSLLDAAGMRTNQTERQLLPTCNTEKLP